MDSKQQELMTEAKLLMLRQMTYYGVFLLGMEMYEDKSIPTAATDGYSLKYNSDWVIGGVKDKDGNEVPLRDRDEIIFILGHEVLHVSFKHMLRQGWREPSLWNVACDYAINSILEKGSIGRYPTLGPKEEKFLDPAFDGWSAEAIYDELLKRRQQQGGGQKIKMPNGVVIDLSKPDPGGIGSFHPPVNADGSGLTESQKAELDRVLDGKAAQAAEAAKKAGKLPAELERLIKTSLKPKVNWRDYLRQFVAKTTPQEPSWAKPHRRYLGPLDMYLPHIQMEGTGKVLVVMDTSGSVSYDSEKSEGAQYFAEIKAIFEDCAPEELHVMYCDAKVAGYDVFKTGEEPELKPRGGGGTDFRPPFKKVAKDGIDIQCAIYLTDGYPNDGWPNAPDYPVMWVITTDVVAPWGQTVKIEL